MSMGQHAGQTVQVIGFGRRLVAYLIDVVILSMVGCMCGAGIGFAGGLASGGSEEAINTISLASNCVGFLLGLAYFVVFWATLGQTPGKMAMNIKVITVDGTQLSWGKALLRYVGYVINGLALSLGFVWVAFDSKRQGWHDKIAGTYVVRKDTQFSSADAVTFVPSDPGQGWIWVVLAVAVIVIIPVLIIAILLLLGPVIGDVFSGIVNELSTPTP